MVIKLKDLGEIITGNTPSKKEISFWDSEDIRFVKPDIISDIGISKIEATSEYLSENARSKARIVKKDTIFVTCIGSIGKVGIASEGDYAFNQQINAIVPNKQIVARYLAYALLQAKPRLEAIANAPVVPIINKSQFGEFQINIERDRTKQQKVVEKLDLLDEIISKRKKEIVMLDELIKARFVELFGDPKLNPYGYSVHQLSEYIEFLTSGSRGWAQYCVDDGPEWFITIKNVKDCHISTENMQPILVPDNAEAKRTRVQEGDLLISITADLGRTGVVTKEIASHGAYINQHLTCIRLNQEAVEPLYVAYYMESAAGKEQFVSKNQSAVKAGLNFKSINSLRLLVPPKEVQQDFLRFVFQVDKSKVVIQTALDETKLLLDSLMQEYFG